MRRAVAQHTNTGASRIVGFNYKAVPSSPRRRSKAVAVKRNGELVRRLFGRLLACTEKACQASGDINVSDLTHLLTASLATEEQRAALLPGIAYFIGRALDGDVANMARYPDFDDPALKLWLARLSTA